MATQRALEAVPPVRLNDYERFHRTALRRRPPRPSRRELFISAALSFAATPFLLTLFLLIPYIGQGMIAAFAALLVGYFWVRRSWAVFLLTTCSAALFTLLFFATIQALKYRLDVTLFLLMATAIPVVALLSLFVASRLWIMLDNDSDGGAESNTNRLVDDNLPLKHPTRH